MPTAEADPAPAGRRRVWIVNHYAYAPDQPSGTRHYDLARELVARGHEVTIFAAGLSHVTGRERLGRGRLYRTEWFEGVRFVWLRTIPYRGNSARRQLNMLSFLAVFPVVQTRFAAPATIVGSTVHPFAALGAWLVARLRGARFVFEIRDLWPQTLVDLGAMRVGSPGERLLRGLEAFLVRRAAAVVTLLPGMRDYLAEQNLPADRVVYIPNGVDPATFGAAEAGLPGATDGLPAVAAVLAAVAGLRAGGRFVFGYVGALGFVNRIDVVIRAAEIAEGRAPGVVGVVLVGDGPERSELQRLAADSPAVTLAPPVPKRAVPGILRALDATVVHATATPVYRYGISFNKLFEYLAAERPVAFACASAYDPVAATGAGITVEPDDPAALADAFLRLAAASPPERDRMGAAGRAYVEREHHIGRLGETFAAVVDGALPQEAGRGPGTGRSTDGPAATAADGTAGPAGSAATAATVAGSDAHAEAHGGPLRRIMVTVARQSWLRKIALSTPVLRDIAWRFVAGEDLDAGIAALRALNARGIRGTLNYVGTHVREPAEAVAAADAIVAAIDRIGAEGVDSHVSVKLTQIGLDIDAGLCRAQMDRILGTAARTGAFVRVDMEESGYVARTIELYEELRQAYGDQHVGIVLQSYLRGRSGDVERLAASGSRIRIVKGGYWEPPEVVYREKAEMDRAFLRDIEVLLRQGTQPALATHDEEAIETAKRVATEIGLGREGFEFQMLYGVRPDLQAALVRDGYAVRCYVPYGGQWYEYVLGCIRRLPGGAVRRLRSRLRPRRA